MSTRRDFLLGTPLLLTAACGNGTTSSGSAGSETAGAPPTLGSGPGSGPAVSPATFAEAEKLAQVTMTPGERQQAAETWPAIMAPFLERRTGPNRFALAASDTPATQWNPVFPGVEAAKPRKRFVRSTMSAVPLPADEDVIAFAPVTQLSRWIESRQLTSERLTAIYLARIARLDGTLRSVITVIREPALARARQADAEIAAGRSRGPLHGIPYGVKDLLDTKGIPTTYGAELFRTRVPDADSAVVRMLDAAGAVLIAKLSLGALALNDVWYGGQTMNPWLIEEGAGGSSAGPGAAVAAGLVGFAIGSETNGSIVNPSMRCGVAGLRPTFGRVPRTGAMTLCWSLDKLGPMTRSVEDTLLVLQATSGADAGDVASKEVPIDFDATDPVRGLTVGYVESWMREGPATDVDRAAMAAVKKLDMNLRAVTLPDWPYRSLMPILFAEGAASFEELTLGHQIDTLKMQVKDAWPNMFRQARFLSAVDFVQADRLRRRVALEMARVFGEVDVLLVPSLREEPLTITNFTGHPSLTLRAGFVHVSQARSDWAPDPATPLPTFTPPRRVPHGVTLIGRLFDEGRLAGVGLALEREFNVAFERPSGF